MSRGSVGYQVVPAATDAPPLLWPWLALSAIWIAAVFLLVPLEGGICCEFIEVSLLAFFPPLVLPLLLYLVVRVLAGCFRP